MDPLEKIAANRARYGETHDALRTINNELPSLVREAFDAGYTGPEIAAVAHVSSRRTYQIRDGRR